jgi:hypothetical protein
MYLGNFRLEEEEEFVFLERELVLLVSVPSRLRLSFRNSFAPLLKRLGRGSSTEDVLLI